MTEKADFKAKRKFQNNTNNILRKHIKKIRTANEKNREISKRILNKLFEKIVIQKPCQNIKIRFEKNKRNRKIFANKSNKTNILKNNTKNAF